MKNLKDLNYPKPSAGFVAEFSNVFSIKLYPSFVDGSFSYEMNSKIIKSCVRRNSKCSNVEMASYIS